MPKKGEVKLPPPQPRTVTRAVLRGNYVLVQETDGDYAVVSHMHGARERVKRSDLSDIVSITLNGSGA